MKAPSGRLKVCSANGLPRFLWWRGRRHTVETVLERWRETGRWWEGEAPKLFFRVETTGGLWGIYFDTARQTWHLYRIYD